MKTVKSGPTSNVALIIVDLQNDFLLPDGAYGRGGAVSETAQALPARVASVARAVKAGGGLVAWWQPVCSHSGPMPGASR